MHINLHMELIEKYQSVILSVDYIFVNGVSFFNAYIPDIRFITSRQQYLKTDLTMQAMNSIKAYYTNRVSIKWNWGQISNLNRHEQRSLTCRLSWTHTYKKHVPDIEHLNRTMKEQIFQCKRNWSEYAAASQVFLCASSFMPWSSSSKDSSLMMAYLLCLSHKLWLQASLSISQSIDSLSLESTSTPMKTGANPLITAR